MNEARCDSAKRIVTVKAINKKLWVVVGWCFFALGFVGVFLPVLPTTPFMILALWAFTKGSEKWRNYLLNHPRFGRPLQDWERYRLIPRKAKAMAVGMMLLSAAYLIGFAEVPFWALMAALGLMLVGASYVLTRPSEVAKPLSADE